MRLPWYPVITIAGALFFAFAIIEWLLFRLEANEDRKRKACAFAAAGTLVMACAGAFRWTAPAHQPGIALPADVTVAVPAVLTPTEQQLGSEMALIRSIITREAPPTLAEVQAGRRSLHTARRRLAATADLQAPDYALRTQTDTLLGVAYHTLGSQWSLSKGGPWHDPEARAVVVEQLARELEKWEQIRACVVSGRSDCKPAPQFSHQEQQLRSLMVVLHPYFIEMVRFEQTDPDLVDSSALELNRLQAVFREGHAAIDQAQLGDWAQQITAAAHALLDAADEAVALERAAIVRGQWQPAMQARIYKAPQDAFQRLYRSLMCATKTEHSICAPT